jgi:segregation and condensation protein B
MTDEDMNKLKRVVEAILFSSSDPLPAGRISRIANTETSKVKIVIEDLIEEYRNRDSAIEIFELNKKYIMRVKPEYFSYVERFSESDMDRGTKRTLIVIALNQPILLSKLAKIRGNKCYEHVKKLEDLGLIKSEKKGKSRILKTTRYFSDYYGLKTTDPEKIKEILLNMIRKTDSKLSDWLKSRSDQEYSNSDRNLQ